MTLRLSYYGKHQRSKKAGIHREAGEYLSETVNLCEYRPCSFGHQRPCSEGCRGTYGDDEARKPDRLFVVGKGIDQCVYQDRR